MVLQAALDLNIDLGGSYVLGDSEVDIEMGRRAGCKTILIIGDKDRKADEHSVRPDYIASDVIGAARWIITEAGNF